MYTQYYYSDTNGFWPRSAQLRVKTFKDTRTEEIFETFLLAHNVMHCLHDDTDLCIDHEDITLVIADKISKNN